MRRETGGEIVYFTQKMGKIVFCLSLVGLMGRKQAAVLVAILMEKGGSRAGGGKRGEARPTRQHTRLGGGGRH